MKRLLSVATVLAVLTLPALAQAQRPTGVIGQYVPPRTWPQGVHNFDLIHQKIAVQFDEAKRLVTGVVTTTVVPLVRTDTIRLNAENMTIDKATDARGRKLRFTYDTTHVTVRLPRRAAAGDTVVFTLAYHTHPVRGIYFVPPWKADEKPSIRFFEFATGKTFTVASIDHLVAERLTVSPDGRSILGSSPKSVKAL